MANDHGAGFLGYVEIGTHADPTGGSPLNITPYLTGFDFTDSIDTMDDTNLSPTNGRKTFLYGLAGATISMPCLPDSAGVLALAIQLLANNRDTFSVKWYPMGKTSGNMFLAIDVLLTNPLSMTGGKDGTVTGTIAGQVSGVPVWDVYSP